MKRDLSFYLFVLISIQNEFFFFCTPTNFAACLDSPLLVVLLFIIWPLPVRSALRCHQRFKPDERCNLYSIMDIATAHYKELERISHFKCMTLFSFLIVFRIVLKVSLREAHVTRRKSLEKILVKFKIKSKTSRTLFFRVAYSSRKDYGRQTVQKH